ncbi:rhomboid family intramembrane serine protease [Luteimonas sp. Y-2-2-4F]|nr:rhomboid family intramembrane serine protease [Luteimonas sp. Y-2-2-4F]MCD9031968.1 rhomboid family intramembrane serine protease [Luteimonas sp. Y-2-2-4F]
MPDAPTDPEAQRRADRRRLRTAVKAAVCFVAVLAAAFGVQAMGDWTAFAVRPLDPAGLLGVLTAPLLHGSPSHLIANASALLVLGTLALAVYPRATVRALPLIWLGSGLGAWLLGDPGSRHLGASGLTHGLMFLVFVLGLLRRDRPSIAAGMIAFLFYGGMLLTVLPQEPGVSWQSHLGGALGGVVSAWLLRRADPQAPRRRYSWELEEEEAQAAAERAMLEPPRPDDVPVLWERPEPPRGVVLPFPRRPHDE